MILQTVEIECVRFGGHIDIEFCYKILWLEVSNFGHFTMLSIGAILRLF
jgi:hypothetical protein